MYINFGAVLSNKICQDRWVCHIYIDLSNPLEVLLDRQVIDRYRIGREQIVLLCNQLTHRRFKKTDGSVQGHSCPFAGRV